MKKLHIFSNRHIKDQVVTIKKGEWIYLENGFSKKRWSLYFRGNNINEKALNITYITQEEFFKLENIKFDSIVANPPYVGKKALHQQFFNKSVALLKEGGQLEFIQPDSAYVSKKVVQKTHNQLMMNNIKKYKTSVKFVEGTVFEEAQVGTSLSITTLTKIEDKTIEVEYLNGDKYDHIDLEYVNKLGVEPNLYKSLKTKIETYIEKNGSLHGITHCSMTKVKQLYKISKLRGHPGLSDFYTMVTRDKDYHKVEDSKFGFKIDSTQEKSMYSYLTTYIARYALSIFKTNPNNHVGEMRIVPLVSFDRIWTDEMLATEIGITDAELDAIKHVLPAYYAQC
jgi:methylase of polypeptide subunit release factors